MDKDQILSIAQSKGSFFVSPHYRNDSLLRRCKKMVREGLLKQEHNWKKMGRYGEWFLPVAKAEGE